MLKATLFLPYVMASLLMVGVAGMIMLANKSGNRLLGDLEFF